MAHSPSRAGHGVPRDQLLQRQQMVSSGAFFPLLSTQRTSASIPALWGEHSLLPNISYHFRGAYTLRVTSCSSAFNPVLKPLPPPTPTLLPCPHHASFSGPQSLYLRALRHTLQSLLILLRVSGGQYSTYLAPFKIAYPHLRAPQPTQHRGFLMSYCPCRVEAHCPGWGLFISLP